MAVNLAVASATTHFSFAHNNFKLQLQQVIAVVDLTFNNGWTIVLLVHTAVHYVSLPETVASSDISSTMASERGVMMQ